MRHREAGSWHVRALTGLQAALLVATCMLFLADRAPSRPYTNICVMKCKVAAICYQ